MTRRHEGRYFLPDQPLHIIQRGNNREAIFFAVADYDGYRGWLADAAAACGCAIHAYVLMTHHVHLLVTPRRADSLPRTMQSLGRRYLRHINATYRQTGTSWRAAIGRRRSTARRISRMLPLHRAQSGAGRNAPASARLSVVELRCAGSDRSAGRSTPAVRPARG
jgi:REP element-mobilizing transposase RayT